MYTIGITGGIGAGKSQVLVYLAERYQCYVVKADEVAGKLRSKHYHNGECYEQLLGILGREVLGEDDEIDKKKMASKIFTSQQLLDQVNQVLHPAVKREILEQIRQFRLSGSVKYYVLEAALLLEEGYDQLLDELWYIYAERDVRMQRLVSSRANDPAFFDKIMKSQQSEEEFMERCQRRIDNSGTWEETTKQIDVIMEGYL